MGLYRKIVSTSFKTFSTHRFNFYVSTFFGFMELVLKISIWQGDVCVRNLELRSDALDALRLPVVVHRGCVFLRGDA